MLEAFPKQISCDMFKAYRSFAIEHQEVQKNTGIMIDDGLIEFCFLKEENIALETNGSTIPLPTSFGFGRVERPFKFIIPNRMTYFAIKIQPWVSSFFFPDNHSRIIDLTTIYKDIDELRAKIFSANNMEIQVRYVEDYFLGKQLPNPENYELSKKICTLIDEHNGNIKINDLLSQFPHSRQKLNKLFLDQTKNSIKEYATYTRLRAVMAYRTQHPNESFTSIIYRFGYFDQAHFIKELKKGTGVTPFKFSKTDNFFFNQLRKKHS